ncbi:molecular chaperone DnaJ [Altererythrobacter sp. SALINAS58]|uniref:J domain-containing protein n=1 Tax=Alteripontixanthobacter muriae TaxID=2705546 RepID=UPI0015764D22|nr:molecular chaperone DnaJ [Alteripontixanthobacter muriae]
MLRLLVMAGLVCIVCFMLFGKWPWQMLGGQMSGGRTERSTARRELTDARRVLGVRKGAKPDEIALAHRRRLSVIHPDRGGSDAEVHEANAARDLLLEDLQKNAKDRS